MFEAEYARRRTTAEAEAGLHLLGMLPSGGGPSLPVDFAAALHGGAAELQGTGAQLPAPGAPGSAYRPACGDAQAEVDFYNTYQQEAQRLGRAPLPTTCAMRLGTGPSGAPRSTAWYSRSPLWTSRLLSWRGPGLH